MVTFYTVHPPFSEPARKLKKIRTIQWVQKTNSFYCTILHTLCVLSITFFLRVHRFLTKPEAKCHSV